jgi:hypothetical protein
MLETIMAVIIGIYAAQAIQFVVLTKTKLGRKFTAWLAKWSFDNSLKLFDDMEEFMK